MTMAESSPHYCAYCDSDTAEMVKGREIYARRGHWDEAWFWRCARCSAYVGCHPGTQKPLGRLANAELRKAKSAAHRSFDRLWRAKIARENCSKKKARGAAYGWLAKQLGIDSADCHIGMFDVAQCRRVVEVCAPYQRRAA